MPQSSETTAGNNTTKSSPLWHLVPLTVVVFGASLPTLASFSMCRITGADARTYVGARRYIPGTPCTDTLDLWFIAWSTIPFAILAILSRPTRDGRLSALTLPAVGATLAALAILQFAVIPFVPIAVIQAAVLLGSPLAFTASRSDRGVWSAGFLGAALLLLVISVEDNISLWQTVFHHGPGFSMIGVAVVFNAIGHLLVIAAGWETGVFAILLIRRLADPNLRARKSIES
jgi:hypothetical protein